jgi:putative DNA primase/helicase
MNKPVDENGTVEEATFTEFTQDSVALDYASQHIDDLRYDHNAGAWYRWTGTFWEKQETKLAFAYARDLVRQLVYDSEATPVQRFARLKVDFVSGVEVFAQRDQRLAVTQAYWDQDLFLLGTPGGTIDLRTGILHPARPEDGITRLTNATPSEQADCPRWFQFLDEVTRGDKELIHFLKVLNGYSLTGSVEEHLLAFLYGSGGNGKSVYLNTIAWVFGAYAAVAAMETFTQTRNDRHPTDMAMLRGARLVTCSETAEGRFWDEVRVTHLTGGDEVTARFMRRDFFTYMPQFQLQIIGNHKPRLLNITDAIRRRLAMVPFLFKPPQVDTELTDKLKAEASGILRWMIEGCLEWQSNGITLPAVVVQANKEYFNQQDIFGRWVDEHLERSQTAEENATKLFEDWSKFAEQMNEEARTLTWFGEQMGLLFTKRKSHGLTMYEGVRLKGEEMTVRVTVLSETGDAYKVLYDVREVWLPKSAVRLRPVDENGTVEATMPAWLARAKSIPF